VSVQPAKHAAIFKQSVRPSEADYTDGMTVSVSVQRAKHAAIFKQSVRPSEADNTDGMTVSVSPSLNVLKAGDLQFLPEWQS
jgi:phage terminase Nu1 subunit (DNA packaging protein)